MPRTNSPLFLLFAALAAPALAEEPAPANPQDQATAVAVQLQSAFSRVAERVFPSVVGVSGYVREESWTKDELYQTKGQAWVESHAEELLYPGFRRSRSGSGFVVGEEGHVLTCAHLLRGPDGRAVPVVSLELPDDSHVLGEIVGFEPTVDLAVLRIGPFADPQRLKLRPVSAADGDRVQVGHWAIAVGDPPGPERTYQVGIVSARAEQLCYQDQLSRTLLQTSLSVPAGGLGGPLVDIQGAVLGMSVLPPGTAVEGSLEGIHSGYALPIGLALNLFEALRVARSTRSPWLGIAVLEMTEMRRSASHAGATLPRAGVFIDNVFDPSPAARAGIRPGDFLVTIEGSRVFSVLDFQKLLYMYGIGASVRLGVFRDGDTEEKTLTIEERPAAAAPR